MQGTWKSTTGSNKKILNTKYLQSYNYQKCCSKQTDINKKAIFKHQVYVICFLWLLLLHNLTVEHFNPFIIDQDPEQEYFMYLKISCHLKRILHNKIPTLQYMQWSRSVFQTRPPRAPYASLICHVGFVILSHSMTKSFQNQYKNYSKSKWCCCSSQAFGATDRKFLSERGSRSSKIHLLFV